MKKPKQTIAPEPEPWMLQYLRALRLGRRPYLYFLVSVEDARALTDAVISPRVKREAAALLATVEGLR